MLMTGDRDFTQWHLEFPKAVEKFVVLSELGGATHNVKSRLCALQEDEEVIWNQSCDRKLFPLGKIENGCLKNKSKKELATPEFVIELITNPMVLLSHWGK
jgi:hypothetical protein